VKGVVAWQVEYDFSEGSCSSNGTTNIITLLLHCWVVVVVALSMLLFMHYLNEVKWSMLLASCEVFLKMNCCCFVLISSLHELLLIIIECEISPLLFECCLYVGNVQITRSNRWCELIPRVVIGAMLWYVMGCRYLYVLFSLLRISLEVAVEPLLNLEFPYLVDVEALVPSFFLKNVEYFPLRHYLNYWKQLFK